jgi:hypothetical protein
MNAHESENYLAISRSSSVSKSVEIFWTENAEIYRAKNYQWVANLNKFVGRDMVPYPIHETGRDVLFTTVNDMTIVNIVNNNLQTLRESKKMCWKIIDLFSLLNLKTI